MKTRSVLVRFPGYPLALENLFPDRRLAQWASCLLDVGHRTRIADYGTLASLDRQFPREGRELLKRLYESFGDEAPLPSLSAMMGYWQLRQTHRAFRARQEEYCEEVAKGLGARRSLDFVLFSVASAEDVAPLRILVERLRAERPDLRILAAGPLADAFAEALLRYVPGLDAVLVGDIERSLVRLAECIREPERWGEIPNLVIRGDAGIRATPRRNELDLGVFPAPAYESDVYPALSEGGKVLLFSVEDSRGRSLPSHAAPAWDRDLRLKPPHMVANEVWRLQTLYGAQAFHFVGTGSPAEHILDVARELQVRGLNVVYGRSTRPEAVDFSGLPLLRASGCRALDFRIDTGSQRLLEDHYGHCFGVSQAEQALRCSRSFELFTTARFVYPCPADDHHTEAETIRVVRRANPDAVQVGLAEVLPGSAWYEKSSSFGFVLNSRTYFGDLLRSRTRFPLPPHRWPQAPYGVGRLSAGEVIRQQEQLILALRQNTKVLFFPGEWALWARLSGYAGREADFQSLSRRLLVADGFAGLAGLVGAFNGRACAPTRAVGFRSLGPLRAAVGN